MRSQTVVTLRVLENGGGLPTKVETVAILVPVRGAVPSRDGVYVRDEGRCGWRRTIRRVLSGRVDGVETGQIFLVGHFFDRAQSFAQPGRPTVFGCV